MGSARASEGRGACVSARGWGKVGLTRRGTRGGGRTQAMAGWRAGGPGARASCGFVRSGWRARVGSARASEGRELVSVRVLRGRRAGAEGWPRRSGGRQKGCVRAGRVCIEACIPAGGGTGTSGAGFGRRWSASCAGVGTAMSARRKIESCL